VSAASGLGGLYAITPDSLNADRAGLLDAVAAALAGGAALIQYRDKRGEAAQRTRTATALAQLCRSRHARFIVNDDVELALAAGADGVHLGATDPPIALARLRLGAGAVVGASCGPSLARAHAAAAAGASYLAFGRLYPSRSKPDAPQASPEVFGQARALHLPLCAIGGILPAHVPELLAAGADLIAAIDGVFGDPQPAAVEAAARRYVHGFAH
jgi:thiamine-phosphate pyrophosphorylase